MQQWEYLFLTIAYADNRHGPGQIKCINGEEIAGWRNNQHLAVPTALNHYGADGWELVEVIWRMIGTNGGSNIDPIYILKRPR